MSKEIRFYSPKGDYFELSNYYPYKMSLGSKTFSSNECFYQSMKFRNPKDKEMMEYYDLISECDSPQKSKDMGNQKKSRFGANWLINKSKPQLGYVNDAIDKYKHLKPFQNWDQVKDDVMWMCLFIKFREENIMKILLDTGDNILIEASPKDYYWGYTGGTGKNMLGKLLMEIRGVYRKNPKTKVTFSLSVTDGNLSLIKSLK